MVYTSITDVGKSYYHSGANFNSAKESANAFQKGAEASKFSILKNDVVDFGGRAIDNAKAVLKTPKGKIAAGIAAAVALAGAVLAIVSNNNKANKQEEQAQTPEAVYA